MAAKRSPKQAGRKPSQKSGDKPYYVEIPKIWDAVGEGVNTKDGLWKILHLKAIIKELNLPVRTAPLDSVPLNDAITCNDMFEFAQHMRHCLDCDSEEPVIMNYDGTIIDGRHRIIKRILNEEATFSYYKIPYHVRPYKE